MLKCGIIFFHSRVVTSPSPPLTNKKKSHGFTLFREVKIASIQIMGDNEETYHDTGLMGAIGTIIAIVAT